MDWHGWITSRGLEATAVVAILTLLARLWRWVRGMRAAAREALARSVGAQVEGVVTPIARKVDRLGERLQQHIDDSLRRRQEDDRRWAQTEEMYAAFKAHMEREDARE